MVTVQGVEVVEVMEEGMEAVGEVVMVMGVVVLVLKLVE